MTDDKRLLRSRKAILEATVRTLTHDPSAGMSDIATAAGVGRATLYRHYDTKEALVEATVVECLTEMEIALDGVDTMAPRDAILATFERLIPMADRYQFLAKIWMVLESDPRWHALEAEWTQVLADLINAAKACGELGNDLPTAWVAAFFDATLEAAWTLVSAGELSQEEAASFACRSFFSGCARRV